MIVDDKSQFPGTIFDLKASKQRHGHAKVTYKIRMPHSGKNGEAMHPGSGQIWKPVVRRVCSEYEKHFCSCFVVFFRLSINLLILMEPKMMKVCFLFFFLTIQKL